MPVYEFECPRCGKEEERICAIGEGATCLCGCRMERLLSSVAIVIAGNMGPKLGNRVALSDELDKQGFAAPLFSSEEGKDKARWGLNKAGIKC